MEQHVVLMIDDDEDDCFLISSALKNGCQNVDLRLASDGDEALDYLHHRGKFALDSPRPHLILLDLHIHKRDGFEILREIRSSAGIKNIPVIVLSGSWEERDVEHSYEAGANAFVVKADTYDEMIGRVQAICRFWLECAVLPNAVGDPASCH